MKDIVMKRLKLKSLDDYFIPLAQRAERGFYFYRFNGTSNLVNEFICKYYELAVKQGLVIENGIPNPTEENLSYYDEIIGMDFQLSVGFIASSIKKWLPRINDTQVHNLSICMYDSLDELRRNGKTENILKNAFVKFMCWLYYKFERITSTLGQDNIPKILYIGNVSTYELMMLSILATVGCDIVLIQTSGDEKYLKTDPESLKSDLYYEESISPFPKDFSLKKVEEEIKKKNALEQLYGTKTVINPCTNAWIKGNVLEDILTVPVNRSEDTSFFYNCFCRINGAADRLTYINELYQFGLSLNNDKRNHVIVSEQISKPTPEEIAAIKRGNYSNIEQMLSSLQCNIQLSSGKDVREILVKAFVDVLLEEANSNVNLNKMLNKAVYLLCWLKRYQDRLYTNWKYPDVGVFIYMGGCKDTNEALFMKFLAKTPVDVLILCPNLNEHCCLEASNLYEVNNSISMTLDTFPEQDGVLQVGTAAYHAERDLDDFMYNDSILFRDNQYSKANVIALRTMDREIKLIWDEELKYRPNFSTVDGVVNMPVIFAKLSGVPDKNVKNYWVELKKMMTPETVVVDKVPYYESTSKNPIKVHAAEFFKNGKLQRAKIKSHPAYQYGYLREEMQEYILDKLELLIAQKLIKGTFENGTEYTIISVALNLPKPVLQQIQNFDFTKKNPKLLYISTKETLITLEDTIYTTYCNLLGFDVLFWVPTGYNIESFFNKQLLEEHKIGDYMYDLQIPNWNTVSLVSQFSFVDRLFKRGQ